MRKKNEDKRQSILKVAGELFCEHGFEKTSMAEINARVGGSKATLYNYFSSKEELLVECVFDFAEHYLENIFSSLEHPSADLETTLKNFGENVIRVVCTPEMLTVRRLIFSEAKRSCIGQLFYKGIHERQQQTAQFLAKAMEEGKLRREDPMVVTQQFRALLEAEVVEACMLSACEVPLSDEVAREAADRAVSVLLRAYAPD